MAEYDIISKRALLKHLDMAIECENCPRNINKDLYTCNMRTTFEGCTCSEVSQICCRITNFVPVADVQPLSVVAEHIKNRLYETAFNTTEEKARNAIADMAGRIDFWIDELKDGDAE